MVLQDLGSKLASALKKLHTNTVVDEEVIASMLNGALNTVFDV